MSEQLELDLSDEPLDVDAFARALGFCPIMMPIHAHFFGGHAGERFLDAWDEARDGPRPEYFALQEEGAALQVLHGQMGFDVWVNDDERPPWTHWFPLPRTFDEAFDRLLQIGDQEESDREALRQEYRLERLKRLMRWMMQIPAHVQ
jgi:hypothetical protein